LYWSIYEVENGKKVAKWIIFIELISIIVLTVIKESKVEVDYKNIIYTFAIITLFLGYYRGNKISKLIIELWMVVIVMLIPIFIFTKINDSIDLNRWFLGALLMFSVGIFWGRRKFIISNEVNDHYNKFMLYQHNKKSKKVINIENIVMIISLILIQIVR